MITELQQGKKTRLELYEILESIEKCADNKLDLIREFANKHASFSDYLRCTFDDRITFLLPDGRPPFDPAEEQAYPSTWHKQNSKLKYIVKGLNADNVNPLRRETIFIGILESVHPLDAEILVDMINKKAPASLAVETVKALQEYIIP
jgi:hypothetical protein